MAWDAPSVMLSSLLEAVTCRAMGPDRSAFGVSPMPDIKTISRIIRKAEAVVGRLTNADRTALLDEYFPEVPAVVLAGMVHGLGL